MAAIVGGFDAQQKSAGQEGVLFRPVPRERQRAAVKYLSSVAFATPEWAVPPEIIRRLEPTGGLSRILTLQRSVLNTLLNSGRMARLQEQEAVDGAAAYRPTEFLADLRGGLFTELSTAAPRINPYRRNLQRAYLDLVDERINGRAGQSATDDSRALFRGELRSIDSTITARTAASADRITRLHLTEMHERIGQILDPKFARATAAPAASGRPATIEDEGCWPDLGRDFRPQGEESAGRP